MAELEETVEFFGIEIKLNEITNLHLRKVMEKIREPSDYNDQSYRGEWIAYLEGSYHERR